MFSVQFSVASCQSSVVSWQSQLRCRVTSWRPMYNKTGNLAGKG